MFSLHVTFQIFKDAQTIAIQLKHSIQSSSSSSSSSVPEVPILSPTTEAIAAELRQEVFASPHESQRIPTVDKGTVTKSKNSDTVTKNKNTVTKNKNLDTVTKSKKSNTVTKDKEKSSTITKDKSGTGTKSKDKENQPKGKISFAQKRLFGMKPSKEPLEDLAKVLPRVPLKDNVMEFSGKAAQEPVAPGSSKVTKMRRSLQRSSGLQKPGTGLGGSFRSKLKPPTVSCEEIWQQNVQMVSDTHFDSNILAPRWCGSNLNEKYKFQILNCYFSFSNVYFAMNDEATI